MKTIKIAYVFYKLFHSTYAFIFAGMAFGLGILFNHRLSRSDWDKHSVALGLILVFFGSLYGTCLGVYLWWRLRTDRRNGGIPKSSGNLHKAVDSIRME